MSSVNIHAEAIYKLTPTCHNGSLAPRITCIMYTYFTLLNHLLTSSAYEGWNFNSGNYLFTTDTK